MGHTTRISDSEMERGWTVGPEVEGVDIEAQRGKPSKAAKSAPAKKSAPKGTTKSKVVEPEKKAPAKKSTARTKSK